MSRALGWVRDHRLLLAINAAILILGLLALEGFARLVLQGQQTPRELAEAAPMYEPALFALHPIARREQVVLNDWWFGSRRWPINRHGYRGDDFAFDKPEGVFRIVVYGGSAVFDVGADDTNDWPHLIQKILRGRFPACNTEVINAGIPLHASHDSVGYFIAEGHLLRPDVVILYNAWNDMRRFHETDPLLRTAKPYAGVDGNPFTSYYGFFDRVLSESSLVYLKFRTKLLQGNLTEDIYRKIFGDPGAGRTNHGSIAVQAIRQYEMNLLTFVDAVRNAGGSPILMKQVRLPRADNTEAEKTKINYSVIQLNHKSLVEAFARTDQVIDRVAARKDAHVIDASGALTKGGLRYLRDTVHLTDEGSQALATLVAEELAGWYGPPTDGRCLSSSADHTFSSGRAAKAYTQPR